MYVPSILVVTNENSTRETLLELFQGEGYQVISAANGKEMFQILAKNRIHLIILDIDLPKENGLILAKHAYQTYHCTLIFLTSVDSEVEKILSLEIGADDYLIKPFNPRELTIRARNIIARTFGSLLTSSSKQAEFYYFNGWQLTLANRTLISPDGQQFVLPRMEFRALRKFCEHPGKVLTRFELLHYMNGRTLKPGDRNVDVTIRRLRKHFQQAGEVDEFIQTVHGEGYRFCAGLHRK